MTRPADAIVARMPADADGASPADFTTDHTDPGLHSRSESATTRRRASLAGASCTNGGRSHHLVRQEPSIATTTRLVGLRAQMPVHKGRAMRDSDPGQFHIEHHAFRSALGEVLRQRREELYLSQQALALAVNVRQSRIWEWEKGLHLVRWDRLLLLCEELPDFTDRTRGTSRDASARHDAPDPQQVPMTQTAQQIVLAATRLIGSMAGY